MKSAIRLLASLLTLGLLSAASPAQAAEPITVQGGGYGHGHGMSQYGAEGAARQGLTHKQILAFYYPGTQLRPGQETLRVWLSQDSDNRLTVPRQAGLSVRKAGQAVQLPSSPSAWRLRGKSGGVVLEKKTSAGWAKAPKSTDLRAPTTKTVEFFVPNKPITVAIGTARAPYRGSLRAVRFQDRLLTVNVVGVEAYLRGVVAREMPASWSSEALKTQAVAARTYALRAANPSNTYYDLCDTSACQVYGGVSAEASRTDAAIKATRTQALWYGSDWAFAQFSASNGGHMLAGSEPYLVSKPDPYDGWAGNPYHTWTVELDGQRLASRYNLGTFRTVEVSKTEGPYAREVVLTGSAGARTFSGWDFRNAADLRSPLFSFTSSVST